MPVDKKWIIQRQGKDMVLYQGLLDLAHDMGLSGIATEVIQLPTNENGQCCVVHARVTMTIDGTDRYYDGIGDGTPDNVGRMIAPHLIRMAETRAKARALRDATNVGITAFEELGGDDHEETTPRTKPEVNRETGEIPFDPKPKSAKAQAVAPHIPQGRINEPPFDLEAYRDTVRNKVIEVAKAQNQEHVDIFKQAIKAKGIDTPGGMPAFPKSDLDKIHDWCKKQLVPA